MKKLIALISGFIFAGVVNAQNTVELTTTQMDQVTAGFVAAGANAGALAESIGIVNIAGTSTYTNTNASDEPGFTYGSAYGSSSAEAFTVFGANQTSSGSSAGVLIIE